MPPGIGVDLRRRSEQSARGGVTGYGIFEVADDAKIDGAVEFTGNATRDRDAWESTLGVRPSGSTPEEMLWSHLIDGDDTGADRARPLRAAGRDDFELHLGGRKTRKLTNAQKLAQAVYVRRDLDKVFDDVEASRLPPGLHRKMLAMEAARMGVDPESLKSKAARWRNERAEEPHTVLCSNFQDLNAFDTINGSWSLSASAVTLTSPTATTCFLRHVRSMSSSNHEVRLNTANYDAVGSSMGVMCRCSADGTAGTVDGYWAGTHQEDLHTAKFVDGVYTGFFADTNVVSGSHSIRGKCDGSTISGSANLSTFTRSFTDTTFSSGVRVMMTQHRETVGSSRTGAGFRAFDGGSLVPTVTGVSPSSGPTAGGTAIEITGTNFDLDATSTTGGNANTSVVVYDDTKIAAVNPAGSGAADVVVTTAAGSGTLSNGFTYSPAVQSSRTLLTESGLPLFAEQGGRLMIEGSGSGAGVKRLHRAFVEGF
jgi:hypothetical protein